MIFAIFSTDRSDSLNLRIHVRSAHRAWLHSAHAAVKLLMSGATLESDGRTMNGSLVVVDAEKLEDVERFAATDPYRVAGLFAKSDIRPWDWTYGNPAGTASINPI